MDFIKILDFLAKWKLDVTLLSIIFSLVIAYIYYKFHKSKHINQYNDKFEGLERDYNNRIAGAEATHYNKRRNLENQFLTKMSKKDDEIAKLKEQVQDLKFKVHQQTVEIQRLRDDSPVRTR